MILAWDNDDWIIFCFHYFPYIYYFTFYCSEKLTLFFLPFFLPAPFLPSSFLFLSFSLSISVVYKFLFYSIYYFLSLSLFTLILNLSSIWHGLNFKGSNSLQNDYFRKKCITLRTISRKVDSSKITIILLITTSECFYVSGGMPCSLYLIHLTFKMWWGRYCAISFSI